MKAVVLDGFTLTAGDLSWIDLQKLCDVVIYDSTDADKVIERAKDAEIILTNKVVLKAPQFDALPKCKYIGVLATGYNVVDVEEAKKRGIVVTNIPSYSSDSVSQLVFAFILNFATHVQEHNEEVHNGKWCNSRHFCYHSFPLQEIKGKNLGVAGLGGIGSKVAKIGEAFGMKVIFYNRSKKNLEGFKQVDKETLLATSDFLSLCLPLNEDTLNFIDEDSLKKVKKGVFIINTGRGQLVDENAITSALKNGKVAGYATDVLSKEPAEKDNPLLASNAVITPHIAWQTYDARKRLMDVACANVKAFIEGRIINQVN